MLGVSEWWDLVAGKWELGLSGRWGLVISIYHSVN